MAQGDVTRLLQAAGEGDRAAAASLYELIYRELRRLAGASFRRERADHTLQPTALVNEAYLRLAATPGGWQSRRHFFGAAAEAMRRILVEHARQRLAQKRGGGLERLTAAELERVEQASDREVVLVSEALEELETQDSRAAELVKLRFFAGLGIEEAAQALGVSAATAKRDWTFARAWLFERLGPDGS